MLPPNGINLAWHRHHSILQGLEMLATAGLSLFSASYGTGKGPAESGSEERLTEIGRSQPESLSNSQHPQGQSLARPRQRQ